MLSQIMKLRQPMKWKIVLTRKNMFRAKDVKDTVRCVEDLLIVCTDKKSWSYHLF